MPKINTVELMGILNGASYEVGGSYVVNPDTANDIDIVVHEHLALHSYKGFHRLNCRDDKYDEIDHVRLTAVHEGMIDGVKYNIIVVGAAFWPAYLGAIAEMRNNPEMYTDRESRVELHRSLSRQVAAIAKIDLPDGAY